MYCCFLVPGVFLCEALTAVDRLVTAGLEGHLGGAAASVTNCIIELAGAIIASVVPAIAIAAIRAAGRAAARLVGEALFSKESLLRSGKGEFGATVAADQSFVSIHE